MSWPHLWQFQVFVPWTGKKHATHMQMLRIFLGGPMGPVHPVWAISSSTPCDVMRLATDHCCFRTFAQFGTLASGHGGWLMQSQCECARLAFHKHIARVAHLHQCKLIMQKPIARLACNVNWHPLFRRLACIDDCTSAFDYGFVQTGTRSLSNVKRTVQLFGVGLWALH